MGTDERDTEERILDAASAVFQRKGTAGARVQEIADEARVNKALVHYYFRSKEKLAQAVFRHSVRQIVPGLLELLESEAPVEEKVRRLVTTLIGTLNANPLLMSYVVGELGQGPGRVKDFVEGVYGRPIEGLAAGPVTRLQEQIDAGVREGTMRATSAQSFLMSVMALCAYPFVTRLALMQALDLDERGFAELMERRVDEVTDFLLAGLRP